MQTSIYQLGHLWKVQEQAEAMLLEVRITVILDWGKLLEGTRGSFLRGWGEAGGILLKWVLVAWGCPVCKTSPRCTFVTDTISYM